MTHTELDLVGPQQLPEKIDRFMDTMVERFVAKLADVKKLPEITLMGLFAHYMDKYARLHCRSWQSLQYYFDHYLSDWHHRSAHSISRFDVQELHGRIGEQVGQTTANRVVEILRMLYNRALWWGLVEDNPARGTRLFKLQSRDRYLKPEELIRFFAALETIRYDTTRDFFLMLLVTGQRRSNVCQMAWSEIDMVNALWHIPGEKFKNGRSHSVPLMPAALEILQRRQDIDTTSPWVFPHRFDPSKPLSRPCKAWKSLLHRTGLTDLRIHDLRRSLASYQAIAGANISTIAQTLGHRDLKSTQIYARLSLDPVRESMKIATDRMFDLGDLPMKKSENLTEVKVVAQEPPAEKAVLRLQPLGNLFEKSEKEKSQRRAILSYDKEVDGLGIRQNPRGPVWFLRYRVNGKYVMANLGSVDTLSENEARRIAQGILSAS